MNLYEVAEELGERLGAIDGLRVFPYTANRVEPPAAIVGVPDELEFDNTYVRGMDTVTFPVIVVVGKTSDRASHINLYQYANGSGDLSVKEALEAGAPSSFDSVRVMSARFAVYTIAATDFLGAEFSVEVIGPGS